MNSCMQQAPNPEAQDPDIVPPLPVHSEAAKQVPFDPEVSDWQALLGKDTIENKLRRDFIVDNFCW